jgi:hypothetical protein
MNSSIRALFGSSVLLTVLVVTGCKEKEQPTGLVVADASVTTPTTASAAPVDISQCAGCQLTPTPSWTFEGVYRDDACTDPLAQIVTPACANVPALGQVSITYVDEVGARKAGENANVTLTEVLPATTPRFRKNGKGCVRVTDGAVDITPTTCAGSRVCRDATGSLVCTGCRTFANGCPDFEETRMYAGINDPSAKGAKPAAGGGGNSLARLSQCCAAIAAEAKRMGSSPEAGVIASAAAQCSALVAQAGPNGTAPELAVVKQLLAGRNLPAVCAGL